MLRLLVDITPIIAFTVAAYGALTFVDPRQETRLVALALINASILSRLVMAVSSLLFSPFARNLRLWRIGDESAHYLHQWIRRLSTLSIYGFFGLQAGYLLGIDAATYQVLLRGLGLLVVVMLLILIAQNRKDVADALGSEKTADLDEPAPVSSFRKGLARVWHPLAGFTW